MLRVVIPTAGTGSRLGEKTKYLNKSLISVNNKPVISHIIEHYPEDTEFVIALGYKGNLVRDYLELAYPEKKFIFVYIDKYEGEGSGLGYTLLKCKEYLQQPFIFHSCDSLVKDEIPSPDVNWMGYSELDNKEQYRTIKIVDDDVFSIIEEKYKYIDLDESRIYIGVCGIYDYEDFWNEMESDTKISISEGEVFGLKEIISKAINAICFRWYDVGNQKSLESTRKFYTEYNQPNILEKPDEAIWFVNDKVIKFSNKESFIKNRVKRANIIQEYVPKIEDSRKNMYSYKCVEGEILSKCITIPLFSDLLRYSKGFWKENTNTDYEKFYEICDNFYKIKTKDRVNLFYKTFNIEDKFEYINGIPTPKLSEILECVDWDWISEGIPGRFHGDYHFENILYNKNLNKFTFLDWRQDFSGELNEGDIYYDLAKLNHGLIICHDLIAKDMYFIDIIKDNIEFDFHRRQILVECEKYFMLWLINNGYNNKKVRIMTALIYLNIAALHHDPYCKLLYYLGKSMLYKELL